jgi:hypothetical protein
MQATPIEAEIARRAYSLWEEEGRPEGRDLDHWSRAAAEIGAVPAPASEAIGDDAPAAAPKKTARRKAAAPAKAAEAAPAKRTTRRAPSA